MKFASNDGVTIEEVVVTLSSTENFEKYRKSELCEV